MSAPSEYEWNITQLAEAFGVSRDTVRKRLKASSVRPVGQSRNAPVYRVADAGKAVFAPITVEAGSFGGYNSPDEMPPKERKDWFDSERSRIALETETKKLAPSHEVAQGYADLVRSIINPLDSLTDLLERKCGITGEALERIQAEIDAIREQMYLRAVMAGADQLTDDDD